MFSTAVILASWYTIGVSYISLSSRHWPYKGEFRGKWTPRHIRYTFRTDPYFQPYHHINPLILTILVYLTFWGLLSIWPYTLYLHAKRGFRTQPGKHIE